MYCCTPKALYNHVRGSLLNHHQCAASTWMIRRLPQDNGASALTTHQLQVEIRESHRAIKCIGIIRRPRLTRASGGNLARTPLARSTPLLFTRSAMGFSMTTESEDFGLTSHPKDGQMRSAKSTILCRALQSGFEPLPYHTEMH